MVPLMSLWMPILLSAVIVFVVSSVIHMVLPYHKGDLKKLPNEAETMAALRKFNIPPGDYMMPAPSSSKDMGSPEFLEKRNAGPVALMTVLPSGPVSMGGSLAKWFVYLVVVGIFAAYVAGRALGPGADSLSVFRFAGVTAFAAYGLALWQGTIWYGRSWTTTLKSTFDALVYALFTAGTFGWLWPS
jgi:hypothetical protein